jgi:hypothetical protein
MQAVIDFIINNRVVLITALFLLSEILALIPSVKQNSIFELVVSAIKWLKEKFVPAEAK